MIERTTVALRRRGHDVHVRFSEEAYAELRRYSEHAGVALNSAVGLLVERALTRENDAPSHEQRELRDQLQAL
jgi:hypothetical protein